MDYGAVIFIYLTNVFICSYLIWKYAKYHKAVFMFVSTISILFLGSLFMPITNIITSNAFYVCTGICRDQLEYRVMAKVAEQILINIVIIAIHLGLIFQFPKK